MTMAVPQEVNVPKNTPSKRKSNQNESPVATKPPKRRRDADQKILDHFWLICDPDNFKRNKSLKIIIELLIKQNEIDNSNDLMYCLDRVIRGMASARQFARHGFCVLLTQMLSIFESNVSLDLVFDLSEKHLGKMDELSNHDSVIGWSLVMASLIKSQRLNSEDKESIFERTFNVLYTLGTSNKPYVEILICELFTQFLLLMTNKRIIFKKIFKKIVELKTENKYKPFFVFIYLSVAEHFPGLKERIESNSVINSDSFQRLSVMIRESTAYHPSVHPFNRMIIKTFMVNSDIDFPDFWNQCIDCVLFTPNQIGKAFLGFELIKIGLQFSETPQNISTIISPSFVRLFIQSLSVKTHPLHSASLQLGQFFADFIKTMEKTELQLEFVNCFTKHPGSLLFDDISKSKFFSNLLRNLNSNSISQWTQRLELKFLTTDKIDSNDILRIRCIQQISNLCKSLTSDEDSEILWLNVKFLFFHSYFESNTNSETTDQTLKAPVIPIGEKLRSFMKDAFRNTFNLLLQSNSKNIKEKLTHEMNTLSSLVNFINKWIANESIKCLANSNSLETFSSIARKILRLKKNLKSNSSKEIEIKIFISLYSMFCIQLFEEYEEIQNIIPDLDECMKRAISEESVDDSGPVWADVLTDLILSVLTTPSKLTKNVLFSCFKHICTQITNTGIQRLVDAIIPSNDSKLFDGAEDSDDGSDEGLDEQLEDAENEESEPESESDSEDESNIQEIDENFRNDVINALGPAAHNDDDEESVYLSDSEMFQIDETLATVFKTKYSDKKEALEKRNSIVAFRLRCLELIHIFLSHKDISLDRTFMFIDPIIIVAKSSAQPSQQNQLSFKAIQLIRQMTKIRDNSGDNSLQINDFSSLLHNLLSILSKSIRSELQKALIQLITWTISLSKKLFVDNDWYSSDIETAFKSFFEKNNCQTPALFFTNLISAHNDIGFKLFQTLFEYAFKEDIRPYKKSTSLEILLFLCKTQNSKTNSISRKQLIAIREKCLTVLCTELEAETLRAQYVSELLKLFSFADKNLKDQNPDLKISNNEFEELSSKLKALSKQKRVKLTAKDVIRKIISNTN